MPTDESQELQVGNKVISELCNPESPACVVTIQDESATEGVFNGTLAATTEETRDT